MIILLQNATDASLLHSEAQGDFLKLFFFGGGVRSGREITSQKLYYEEENFLKIFQFLLIFVIVSFFYERGKSS